MKEAPSRGFGVARALQAKIGGWTKTLKYWHAERGNGKGDGWDANIER
jgi:hypothetical protein